MKFTFILTVAFKNGTACPPYRSTGWWKTIKGAQNAGRELARDVEPHYRDIKSHMIEIKDDYGRPIHAGFTMEGPNHEG